jgi:ribosomal protein S18 acetylase RimI-like enzyme
MRDEGSPEPRRVRSEDLAAIAALWRSLADLHAQLDPAFRVAGDAVPARALVQLVDHRDVAAWVVEVDSKIAGFCVARMETAPAMVAEAGRAEITELFVTEEARRRGLGRTLAETALLWAASRDVSRVEVRVSARNDVGRSFWRSLGFGAFVDVLDRRL